ncbi:hypothetical protein [Streptomyces sp. NBC_01244]|uniref:hypothetical protein n=1 Tax=Streptomyces sp. NBC_01244 TaxID=2903797 RepID=UPI002E152968|nr:hypothetical protein OG247_18430 [Streptomyces sp. NBC_01244]
MTPDPRSSFPIDLDLLYELLDVDRSLPVRRLLQAARLVRGVLAPLVLSLAVREGTPMGSGSRGELERLHRRIDTYARLNEEIARVPGARVVKGPSLARYYPEGVLRPLGDLDVVTTTEAALWQVLALVTDRHHSDEAELTELYADGQRHVFAGVWWTGEDPLLDPDHCVDITTFAFHGRPGLVPLRAALPEDQAHADVLSLAEERFQRPFTVKDILDLVFVMTSPAAPRSSGLIAAATEFALAPELLELCERVRACPRLAATLPSELVDGLRAPAEAERLRRAEQAGPPQQAGGPEQAGGPQESPVPADASPAPRYGMLLATPLRRGAGDSCTEHRWSGGAITRTPIADFLMVPGELVDPDSYESALAELSTLTPWPLRPDDRRPAWPHSDRGV